MYDTIIIGCGPAGLTAALYLARANKKVLVLEHDTIGGQIASSPLVENYPGYKAISGSTLTGNMFEQIISLGVAFEIEEVTSIVDGPTKKVITDYNTYETKTIIIATGSIYRRLGLPNEDKLIGKGIHFCVACDAPFYKNKDVAVIGGGNSAVINALSLAEVANHVTVIQNIDKLTSEANLTSKLLSQKNVSIIYNAKVTDILGDKELTGITISTDNQEQKLTISGMFLAIGLVPATKSVKDIIALDSNGYIISTDCQTNIPGIFVAGDCRTKQFRQLTTATSDGTTSALLAVSYLNK